DRAGGIGLLTPGTIGATDQAAVDLAPGPVRSLIVHRRAVHAGGETAVVVREHLRRRRPLRGYLRQRPPQPVRRPGISTTQRRSTVLSVRLLRSDRRHMRTRLRCARLLPRLASLAVRRERRRRPVRLSRG